MVTDMFEIKLILHSCPPFETKKQLCSLSVTLVLSLSSFNPGRLLALISIARIEKQFSFKEEYNPS